MDAKVFGKIEKSFMIKMFHAVRHRMELYQFGTKH
jgi:hypothetical protein